MLLVSAGNAAHNPKEASMARPSSSLPNSRNSFQDGKRAAHGVAYAMRMGWHDGPADLAAALEWVDQHVPDGNPGTMWWEGFRLGMGAQGYAHRLA